MTANAGVAQAMATDGAAVVRAVFPPDLYASFRSEVLAVVRQIDPAVHDGCGGDIDRAWQALTAKDRKLGGHVYDALKHSMTVRRFATSEALRGVLRDSLGSENLAVVDINFPHRRAERGPLSSHGTRTTGSRSARPTPGGVDSDDAIG
nr:hypothetical protein [Deltaproteobacteria bacterium]